jgi:hypothetical protein
MEVHLSSVTVDLQNINGVVRRFRAECPDCGPFSHDRPGHHDTINETALEELFPKHLRKRIRLALSGDERKLFVQTLAGKREPKEGEIKRWLEIQNRLSTT